MSTFKLPTHPYILCTTPGCERKTTCFGKNLQAKASHLSGGIDELVMNFKCRDCRQPNKSSTLKPKSNKQPKAKRVTKKETRALTIERMICSMPTYQPTARNTVLLKDSPEYIIKLSKESGCLRPDIFLDCGRKCDDCPYNHYCQSNNKTFSKHFEPKQPLHIAA